jgi:hypothetical protein
MEKIEDYLQEPSLHPNLDEFPMPPIEQFENVILYGPAGVGKYTQALRFLRKYSDHGLKYEKKVVIDHNDSLYVIKVTDVHFEVDMEQLGNASKPLWHEIYCHIKEISNCARNHHIVLCKNFQKIDQELLEIFYSYMQDTLKFILLTDAVSFIPMAVTCRCKLIPVPRPILQDYVRCGASRMPVLSIKDATGEPVANPVHVFGDKLWPLMLDPGTTISKLREELYVVLVYDLDVDEFMWYLLKKSNLDEERTQILLSETANILQRYRCNYRPIYHLETFVNVLSRLLYV